MRVEPWVRLLDRMPGVAWSMRGHPVRGELEWVNVDLQKMEALYDVPEAELAPHPKAFLQRIMAEDRVRLEQLMVHGAEALSPWSWAGRLVARSGEIRSIEMQTIIEADEDGARRWYIHAIDVTEPKRVEEAVAMYQEEVRVRDGLLARSEEVRAELADRVRATLDQLSTPILEVWEGVLAMPIVGAIDSRRTANMAQRLLAEVTRTQATFVIVDLTGVDVVDTMTADHLMKLMRKIEVVGARCVLTGIQPAMAETLVDIGVDFGNVTTLRNLKHALREALDVARREREEVREEDLFDEEPEKEKEPRKRSG